MHRQTFLPKHPTTRGGGNSRGGGKEKIAEKCCALMQLLVTFGVCLQVHDAFSLVLHSALLFQTTALLFQTSTWLHKGDGTRKLGSWYCCRVDDKKMRERT